MHERGGLERVPGSFISHFDRGQFAQFLIDQRQQLIRSLEITLLDGVENACDITHEVENS